MGEMNRGDFLKVSGLTAGALLTANTIVASPAAAETSGKGPAATRSAAARSALATNRSIVTVNSYGYRSQAQDVTDGRTTTPRFARIDIDARGKGHLVWSNTEVVVPDSTPKMSLTNGLICLFPWPR